MNKALGILMLLIGFKITSVCACSPIIYVDTTIMTVEGEEFDYDPKYNYDLLFSKVEYPEYYQEAVNNQIIVEYPIYESFTFYR